MQRETESVTSPTFSKPFSTSSSAQVYRPASAQSASPPIIFSIVSDEFKSRDRLLTGEKQRKPLLARLIYFFFAELLNRYENRDQVIAGFLFGMWLLRGMTSRALGEGGTAANTWLALHQRDAASFPVQLCNYKCIVFSSLMQICNNNYQIYLTIFAPRSTPHPGYWVSVLAANKGRPLKAPRHNYLARTRPLADPVTKQAVAR
ncbi:hypothetical protein [Desulfofustis glycolicus]|uniref:hypothetical protein n=1 Tax=Desulfofustis glycolicus TaxID=51195 RepID=UPI00137B1036|nr:hypothetical protein [Desulfofustis glycolicus]